MCDVALVSPKLWFNMSLSVAIVSVGLEQLGVLYVIFDLINDLSNPIYLYNRM